MTYGMYFPVLLCVFIPVRFYPIPLGFAASALKLSFRTLQSFPSCWTKTAAMRELVHVQGGHIFTVCSVVVGHHESFDLDLLFAYTIWTSIHMYWQHLLLITVHWVQLTKIEDFHWTRLFCFTSNGKVSAATRSEPSSGRSLRMNMALTPLVLGLNDWLPLYGCLFLRSAVGWFVEKQQFQRCAAGKHILSWDWGQPATATLAECPEGSHYHVQRGNKKWWEVNSAVSTTNVPCIFCIMIWL